ncbi:MAG: hypothetical protein ACO1G9_05890 [Bacteroidota bacterium]
MFKKFLLLFALVASMISSASAYTIIIAGGGPNHKYNYILLNSRRCECRGTGHNDCPVSFSVRSGIKIINLQEVVTAVQARYAKGEKDGSIKFEGILPVSWKTTDKDELVITTVEDEVLLEK